MAITKTTVTGPILDASGIAYDKAALRFVPRAPFGDDAADTVLVQSPVEARPDVGTGAFSIALAPSENVSYVVSLVRYFPDREKAYPIGEIKVPTGGPVALQDLLKINWPDVPTLYRVMTQAEYDAVIAAAQMAAINRDEAVAARDDAQKAYRQFDFHAEADEPLLAFADKNGEAFAVWNSEGRQVTRVDGEFCTGFDEYGLVETDENGVVLRQFTADGRQVTPALSDFYTGQDDPAVAVVLEDFGAILQIDQDGCLISDRVPGQSDALALMPMQSGAALYSVGAETLLAADLGAITAIDTAPGNLKSVRAVIDRPGLDAWTSVSAAGGLMIPDARPLLHVYVVIGQSLSVGANSQDTLISVQPAWPDDALMPEMAGVSDVRLGDTTTSGQPADPLDPASVVGFTPLIAKAAPNGLIRGQTVAESFATSLAQSARDIGVSFRSLSFTAGVGGSYYSMLKKGSQIYANMLIALERAKLLAEARGWRLVVDAALVKHGESDGGDPAFLSYLTEWQTDIDVDMKAITGQVAPVHFIMTQPSSRSGDVFEAVQAMLDAHNTSPVHHLAGADYPYLDTYASDYLHFLGLGYYLIGETMARAARQALWTATQKSSIVQITEALRTGQTVVLTYEVPVPPLVFDTAAISERDVKGYRFFDDGGEIAISGAAITGPSEVTLTLASAPSGVGEYVAYAMRGHSGTRNAAGVPRGNVRDSAADVSTYQSRPMQNWAVHQKFDL